LSFLLHKEIVGDEAGHLARITGYGSGYWLWVLSIGVAGVAAARLPRARSSPGTR
jgi:hypothetical protein